MIWKSEREYLYYSQTYISFYIGTKYWISMYHEREPRELMIDMQSWSDIQLTKQKNLMFKITERIKVTDCDEEEIHELKIKVTEWNMKMTSNLCILVSKKFGKYNNS